LTAHDSPHDNLVTIRGKVTAFAYDDEDTDDDQNDADDFDDDNETDDIDDEDETDDADDVDDVDEDETEDARIMSLNDKHKIPAEMKVSAFVIDNDTLVELGPWWYWVWKEVNITDFVHIGDWVNVTGEMQENDDGMDVIEAWHIDNTTTGKDLTIKEEGRPPWAGGPKALDIDPWPMSE